MLIDYDIESAWIILIDCKNCKHSKLYKHEIDFNAHNYEKKAN